MSQSTAPALSSLPLIGLLLRGLAGRGDEAVLVWLVAAVAALAVAVTAFGYAALILAGLAATWGMLATLILLTRAR